ncbi:helix-turn-helix domain-containing protein [Streptomyces caeruleatus]|uniref:helix-turn-helix domain-containing protein n=1 Tax=Streptomyces caeruleatus TaxID=661399 RepID=UPI00131CFA66
MGRREKPVDPDAGPVQRLAHDLRVLRQKAGTPPYREMAERAGYSTTALSQAAAGEQLPTRAVVRAYAEALDADPDAWERRWREADAEVRAPAPDETPPYRGLARFEPDDSHLFFGREALVGELLELVREHRFAAVFGRGGPGPAARTAPARRGGTRLGGTGARPRRAVPGHVPGPGRGTARPAAGRRSHRAGAGLPHRVPDGPGRRARGRGPHRTADAVPDRRPDRAPRPGPDRRPRRLAAGPGRPGGGGQGRRPPAGSRVRQPALHRPPHRRTARRGRLAHRPAHRVPLGPARRPGPAGTRRLHRPRRRT